MTRLICPRPCQMVAAILALVLGSQSGVAAEPESPPIPTSAEFFQLAEKDSEGRKWQPLFNGKDLEGWKVVLSNAAPGEDPENIFQVADGQVHVYRDTPAGKEMPFGVILSDHEYSDYRFRFEYKWGEKKFAPRMERVRDAGLLFHVIGPEKVWPMSVECQVQEMDTGDNYLVYTSGDAPVVKGTREFQPFKEGGTLANFYRPGRVSRIVKSRTLEKEGWNVVEVIVRKDAAIYMVNGEINNYVVNMRAPIGPGGEMVPLTSGRLALQCEWAELYYRNIEVMPLDELNQSTFVPADESNAPTAPRSPEAGLAAWKMRDGYRAELVAAEPLIMDPVAIDWGLDGKLWVVEMADYPLGMDDNGKPGGRVRFLEKSQPDGPYDRSTLFLDGLSFPTGIVSWDKGVIVTAAPEIFYAEDTDGDGVCDLKKTLFSGFHEGNQQLRINGLRWGLDGWLHCACGSHRVGYGSQSTVHSHVTGKDIALGSRDFRFNPETGELDPLSGPSQFGRNRDDWGNWFGEQNSYPLWHYVYEDKYLRRNPNFVTPDPRQMLSERNPRVFPAMEIGDQPNPVTRVGRFTSSCSGMVYRDQLLPLEQDSAHAFTCEPVHNLIQHNLLKRSGASFTLERDAEGEAIDFLTSTDPWCRPVMARTGPDGALWVVDMYRFYIEHPQWVPDAVKLEMAPHLRLGDGRGRLYRVLPASGKERDIPNILNAPSLELVKLLDHPNGWVRDSAQRQLVERQDAASVAPLKEFLESACTPQGKLHAAYALKLLNACDSSVIHLLLDHPSAEIRRHGLKLAEEIESPEEELLEHVVNMVDDPSDVVRQQLAFSLGEWNHPKANKALANLYEASLGKQHIETALLSSLNQNNIVAVQEMVANHPVKDDSKRAGFRQLLQLALAFQEIQPFQVVVQPELDSEEDLARAIIGLDVFGHQSPESLNVKHLDQDVVSTIHQRARELVEQDDSPSWMRTLGVSLLFRWPDSMDADRELVQRLLSQAIPAPTQAALIRHLGEQKEVEYGELLLSGWSGYVPSTRNLVLENCAAHPEWASLLVDAIDQGLIDPLEINLPLQERFLTQKNLPAVQELQKRFHSQTTNVGLTHAAAQQVLQLTGDIKHGREVFQKNCVDCHRFQDKGHIVGPNLASVTGRTPETLLDAITNPNKAIEPKYLNYALALSDGRVLSGLIESDSETSLTLLNAKGVKSSVLRSEIEELRSTGKSLMPDGFARTIPPQSLADLILYLQQTEGSLSRIP